MSYIEFASTTARVSDTEAVRQILDDYWYYFDPEVRPDEVGSAGALTIWGDDEMPHAVHVSDWPDDEKYPEQDAWGDAMIELKWEKGEEGFTEMLRELAPYLETPLTVVWSAIEGGCFFGAVQWTVTPGCPDVQVQRVDPLPWPLPAKNVTALAGDGSLGQAL